MRNDRFEQDLCEQFGLVSAPTLSTSPLTKAPIRFSRLRRDWSDSRPTKRAPWEDAYAIHIALCATGPCETWMNGRKFESDTIPNGAATLLTLDSGPSICWHSAYDFMRIHIPRLAIDELADEAGLPRPARLRAPFFKLTLDSALLQLATAALPAFEAPAQAGSLFLDHIALATLVHVHLTYLGSSSGARRLIGGLAPWQERRAKELMTARLDQQPSVADLASECRLSCSHFARAFTQSTGLPPHRWLLAYRVAKAKEMLLAGHTPLQDIASACGFGNQGHMTRVFARSTGESPAAWRRIRKT
jgi:AraC family transcriptional regulator